MEMLRSHKGAHSNAPGRGFNWKGNEDCKAGFFGKLFIDFGKRDSASSWSNEHANEGISFFISRGKGRLA
jgi:hypothetical protein